ncbi:MAG: hypothetical protein ACYS47_20885, partial [Planctomycetota bacterium]
GEVEEKLERDVFSNEKEIDVDSPPILLDCRDHLLRIFSAILDYRNKRGGGRYLPPLGRERLLVRLALDGFLRSPRFLLCPDTKNTNLGVDMVENPEKATDYTAIDNSNNSPTGILYLLLEKKIHISELPLVWDKKGNHAGFRHVLFLDGHVEKVAEGDFQKRFAGYE